VYYRSPEERIGCNRIECSVCKSTVRHFDGYSLLQKDLRSRADYEKLYASPDPSQWSFLRKDPQYRTYFCRCSWAHTFGIKEIPYVDSADGWYCAGHPQDADSVRP
jgi:hypothetical protein